MQLNSTSDTIIDNHVDIVCNPDAGTWGYFPAVTWAYFFLFDLQKMNSDTKLPVKDATGAKTLANSTSRRPECNGRRPGLGFGRKSRKNN